jgi:hypothetical protein
LRQFLSPGFKANPGLETRQRFQRNQAPELANVPLNKAAVLMAVPAIDFNSGYVLRALDILPQQRSKAPWRVHQDYL